MAKTQPSFEATRRLAGAVVGFGVEMGTSLLNAEERMQYNAGMEAIDRGITNFDSLLKQDPEWQTYTDKAAAAEEDIWNNVEQGVTNIGAKNKLYAYMQQKRSQHLENISSYQTTQRVAEAVGTLNATVSSIMSDGTTPPDVRKQKIAQILGDAYETNLIDNPTRGAKETELFHEIDTQAVSSAAWNVFAAGGDWMAYIEDPANQMGLDGAEIQKISASVFSRVQEKRNQQKWIEENNNTPIDTTLGVAFQTFLSGKGDKDNLAMNWEMLSDARVKLLGTNGNDIYEKWVMRFKTALDAGSSGGEPQIDYTAAAPFMKEMHDPEKSAINKLEVAFDAYTSGKLGKPGSAGAVKTMEYMLDNRSDDSKTLSNALDEIHSWGQPNPVTGTSPLISATDAAFAQETLQEYVRKNKNASSIDIIRATEQIKNTVTDTAIKRQVGESWKSRGTFWGLVGAGTPDMAAVSNFTEHLQNGNYSYLKDTAEFGLILESVKATQTKDLEAKLAKPRNNILFKIDPAKTKKSKDGTPYFYDQYGTQYFYDRLDPKNPSKWNWYFRRVGKDGKLIGAEVLK
jgi:hypothetical protein